MRNDVRAAAGPPVGSGSVRGQQPSRRERSRAVWAWRLLRTRQPRTFTEKVRYKMLRDHRPLLVTFADKAAVRDYVTGVVGGRYLPELYGVVEDPAGLRSLDLPSSYVLKPTHGSGAVVIVSPAAPVDGRLPAPTSHWVCRSVRPDAVDQDDLERLCAAWLDRLHGHGPNTEWAYTFVPRRLLAEEYLTDPDAAPGGTPDDYKFFVFHGRCHYVQVDSDRLGHHYQDFYTPSWHRLPMNGGLAQRAEPHPRPRLLAELLDVAQRLGRDTDFVRVDLYALGERVVFGELTSYPAGGHSPFEPASFDAEFGSHWTVPRRYR